MDSLPILILGAIQGATEFLPVSSSGHLALGKLLMADGPLARVIAEQPLTLDILLHLATLLAVGIYYRKEIAAALRGFGRSLIAVKDQRFRAVLREDEGANLAWAVIVGTLPTGIIGLLLENAAVAVSTTPMLLGCSFMACAGILIASRFWQGGERRLTMKLALLIGIAQGVAVLPGISRSGTTIAVALALGLGRKEAARFSFLLSMPAIIGAALLEMDLDALQSSGQLGSFLLGAACAFAVGLLALVLLVQLVRRGRLWVFAPYVAAAGFFSMFLL